MRRQVRKTEKECQREKTFFFEINQREKTYEGTTTTHRTEAKASTNAVIECMDTFRTSNKIIYQPCESSVAFGLPARDEAKHQQ